MYNSNAENKVKFRKLSKVTRSLSLRKVWISKPELKHTNDKIIINIYVYDRINNIILMKLRNNIDKFYSLKLSKIKSINFLNNNLNTISNNIDENKIYSYLITYFKSKNKELNNKFIKAIRNISIDNKLLNNAIKVLFNNLQLKFLKRILKREMNILYYKKFLSLNTLKYKSIFISVLQKLLGKIYNKKIIFNIVSLKNYYLSASIFTKIIAEISKDRHKSTHILLNNATKISTPLFRKNIINKDIKNKYIQNVVLKYNFNNRNNDLNLIFKDYYGTNYLNFEQNLLNKLNNKLVIGVRLEAAGRLTKRFTAQRAVKNIKYIGTLKNIDSSFKGLSNQVLRNNVYTNIQFSKTKSENRIGSFGIKGWISSV